MTDPNAHGLDVLLVEDNPGDVRLIEAHVERVDSPLLSREVEIHTAGRLSAAFDVLDETPIDLVMLDLGLPDSSGLDTLESITDWSDRLPVVVLTVLDDKPTAVKAIKGGAQDYLYKGNIDEETLARTMRYAIERNRRERKLRERSRQLKLLTRILRHDVRTDISVIQGSAELVLDDEELSAAGRERLEAVVNASTHVDGLIETAREYADAMLGEDDVEPRPVSLPEVLSNAVRTAESTFDDAEFTLTTDVPETSVRADELLASVFRNLLNNAVQHNDSPTPEVEVTAAAHGEAVEVRVADNGPGVPDHLKSAIFREERRDMGSNGTGLGLHLVDRLVDRYGGEVRVEDNQPTGAVFAVRLPIAE